MPSWSDLIAVQPRTIHKLLIKGATITFDKVGLQLVPLGHDRVEVRRKQSGEGFWAKWDPVGTSYEMNDEGIELAIKRLNEAAKKAQKIRW